MLTVSTKKYLCFDEDGEIKKISNDKDQNLDNFEIEVHEILGFLEGRERLIDYKMSYDYEEKRYKLIHKETLPQRSNYGTFVHELTQKDYETDVTIIKDNTTKVWKLVLNPKIADDKMAVEQAQKSFSVTKKYDPNILYKVLKFSEENNFEIPFDDKFEFDNEDISLYTIRRFEHYNFEVLND